MRLSWRERDWTGTKSLVNVRIEECGTLLFCEEIMMTKNSIIPGIQFGLYEIMRV